MHTRDDRKAKPGALNPSVIRIRIRIKAFNASDEAKLMDGS